MRKIRKEILSFLLATVFTIVLLQVFFPDLAEAASSPEIYIEDTEYLITRTDNVLVPVKISALPIDSANGTGTYAAGQVFATFPKDKLTYVGVEAGTMKSGSGKVISWQTRSPADCNKDGIIRTLFYDTTSDKSGSYGEGSFVLGTKDILVYLEFKVVHKTSGDTLPITITDARLSGGIIKPAAGSNPAVYMPDLVMGENLDTEDGEITIIGQLTSDIEVNEDAGTTVSSDNLIGAVDESDNIGAGKGVQLVLIVKNDDANTETKTKILAKLDEGQSLGAMFDISLKEIISDLDGSKTTNQITETDRPVTLTIEIPEDMRGGSDYQVVCVHDGIVIPLETTRFNNYYLKFSTSRFSTYGIIYSPPGTPPNPPSPPSGGGGSGGIIVPVGISEKHTPYIKGYSDGTFRPDANITRAEVVAILARMSSDFNEASSYSSVFKDVAKGAWYANYIGYVSGKGIVNGYSDGNFKTNANMTRAEFAAVIVRTMGDPTANSYSMDFKDLSDSHWAYTYIATLTQKGIMNGYPDNTFRPGNPITRAEVVKVINRITDRTPDKVKVDASMSKYQNVFKDLVKSHWAYYEMLEATIEHDKGDFH